MTLKNRSFLPFIYDLYTLVGEDKRHVSLPYRGLCITRVWMG